jgi:uncharacterized RDD family membrane protein YckC
VAQTKPDILASVTPDRRGTTIATTNEMTLPGTADRETQAAHLRARIGGYVVDMVIFGAVTMIMTVLAGFTLLASIDWGTQDPTDPELYTFLAIIGLGTPLVWTALNLFVLARRGQTGGQYVAGLRLVREDGNEPRLREATAWWFCFNPLLFSWPMTLIAGLPLVTVVSLLSSSLTIVVFGVVVTLCLACPIIALVSALIDRQNRALYDRVAGVIAVPSE